MTSEEIKEKYSKYILMSLDLFQFTLKILKFIFLCILIIILN